METIRREEMEIDLKQVFTVLLGNIAIIILAGILCASAMYTYSKFFVQPIYQSSTQIYILSRSDNTDNLTSSELYVATYLTSDYQVLITSDDVMQQVISNLQLDMSPSALKGKITVEALEETRIIKIIVQDSDPWRARDIANAVREASKEKIKEVMDVESVNEIDTASLPTGSINSSAKRNTLIALVFGVVVSALIILIKFLMDDTIKTPDDIEKYLGVSVLASIPLMEEGESKKGKNKKNKKKKNKPEKVR